MERKCKRSRCEWKSVSSPKQKELGGEEKNGENESKGTKTTEEKKKRNSERRKAFTEEEGEEKTLG